MLKTSDTGSRFELWTDWAGYQKILDVVGERPIHVTYDRGRLELLSPGKAHERGKSGIRALLECLMNELEVDYEPGGSTTFNRKDLDRGFEPDECYWIAHWEAVAERTEWNSEIDPPPDLALEVEITSSAIDRLALYHALGVPEVWRLTKTGQVIFLQRRDDAYHEVAQSPTFPWLAATTMAEWVARRLKTPHRRLIAAFRVALPGMVRAGGSGHGT